MKIVLATQCLHGCVFPKPLQSVKPNIMFTQPCVARPHLITHGALRYPHTRWHMCCPITALHYGTAALLLFWHLSAPHVSHVVTIMSFSREWGEEISRSDLFIVTSAISKSLNPIETG